VLCSAVGASVVVMEHGAVVDAAEKGGAMQLIDSAQNIPRLQPFGFYNHARAQARCLHQLD
jgi:hypothetical protein